MAKRKSAEVETAAAAPARRQRRGAAAASTAQNKDQQHQQLTSRRSTRSSQQQQQQQQQVEHAQPQSVRKSIWQQRQQQSDVANEHSQQLDGESKQQQYNKEEAVAAAAAAETAEEQLLDDFSQNADLAAAVEALSAAAADPTVFLQPNTAIAQAARQAAKELLQYTVTSCADVRTHAAEQQQQQAAGALADLQDDQQQQQLYVGDGFDSEQVWLQLDMHLGPLRKRLRKLIGQLGNDGAAVQHIVLPEHEAALDEILMDDSDAASGSEEQLSSEEQEDEEGNENIDDTEEAEEQQQQQGSKQAKKALLPTEDRFFRLDAMEAFVAEAERQAAALDDDDDDDDADEDESEEPIDFFGGTANAPDDETLSGAQGRDDAALGSDDEQMEALLNSTAALVGKQRHPKQQQQQQKGKGEKGKGAAAWGGDSDQEESEDQEDVDAGQIYYQDFFGAEPGLKQRPAGAAATGGDSQDEDQFDAGDTDQEQPEAVSEDHSDLGGSDSEDFDEPAGHGSEFESDEDSEPGRRGAAAAAAARGSKRVKFAGLQDASDDEDGEVSDSDQEQQPLSTHEKRLMRMQERIAEYEEAAMGEKPWHLVGEVQGSARPLNSALEIDMDYETTNKPPPAPTEEATQTLEDILKRRIAENRWDDVVRVLPPPTEVKKRQVVDLDDTKAQQGLGEIYEAEYVQQVTGFTAADKHEPMRKQAQALFKALCGKLDAISSFAFAPKPVVEELEVRSDVTALALEEVAPLAVSDAALRTPAEVFKPEAKGEAKAEEELTQEERKRRRAKKKRSHRAKEAAKEAAAAARAAASGDATALAGRKFLAKQLAAATSSGLIKKGVVGAGRSDYGKSTAVFGKIAEQAAAGKGGKEKAKGSKDGQKQLKAAMLKL